jgi:hypothetical protein
MDATNEKTLAELGREVLRDNMLDSLQYKLGLGDNTLARMLGISYDTFINWKNGAKPWRRKLVDLGEFWTRAMMELDKFEIENPGKTTRDLVPISQVAAIESTPREHLEEQCRTGQRSCVDLGVLGRYMWARDLER